MTEECCHSTAASKVHIASWEELVKPKALELSMVLLFGQLLAIVATERIRQNVCTEGVLTIQAIFRLRETLLNHSKSSYCSLSEGRRMHLPQIQKLLLPPLASAATFPTSLSYSFVEQHNTNLCIDLIMCNDSNVM